MVCIYDVHNGRNYGVVDTSGVISTWFTVGSAGVFQSVDDDAWIDNGIWSDHAGLYGICELAGSIDDRGIGHGICAVEQLVVLVVAAGGVVIGRFIFHAERSDSGGLDVIRAVVDATGDRDGHGDFCDSLDGDIIDYGSDKHNHDDFQHASAGNGVDANAVIHLDMVDNGIFIDSGDAGISGRGDDVIDGPSFWDIIL